LRREQRSTSRNQLPQDDHDNRKTPL
jgi:hypothetical protein